MDSKKYKLPSMEHRFKINVVGEDTKINWSGEFLYRRPTLREKALIEVFRVKLNQDMINLNPDVISLNESLAYLKYTIRDCPEWWTENDLGGALHDPNILVEVYNKCMEFEKAWHEKVHGGKAEDVEAKDEKIKEPARSVAKSGG